MCTSFARQRDGGRPFDCSLCPDHQRHACRGIIEVNSACDVNCPLCFAQAGAGFSKTLEEFEEIAKVLAEQNCIVFPTVYKIVGRLRWQHLE
jgi:hypothetical protein